MGKDEKQTDNVQYDRAEDKKSGKYRFGMGIELVDQNIISGPDVERAVNGIIIAPDRGDDEINRV